nr:acyltransferase [Dermacoccus nishinomiyaensis]
MPVPAPRNEARRNDDGLKTVRLPPGLDGIRGYSMVVFMLWHVGVLTFLPGAWILMNVFFILSAFLITRLLLAEQREFGWISVREFYRRRVRRLAPALLVMVGAVTLDGWAFAPAAERTYLRGDILATLTYVMNWRLVLRDDQYFEEFTHPSITRHAWSLSVEEQFYLVVPLLIIAALTYAHRRSARTAGFVVLALASAAWASTIDLDSPGGQAHAYYGTDVRMQALALGVAAGVWTGHRGRGGGLLRARDRRDPLDAETAGSRSSAGSASSRRSQASRSSSR